MILIILLGFSQSSWIFQRMFLESNYSNIGSIFFGGLQKSSLPRENLDFFEISTFSKYRLFRNLQFFEISNVVPWTNSSQRANFMDFHGFHRFSWISWISQIFMDFIDFVGEEMTFGCIRQKSTRYLNIFIPKTSGGKSMKIVKKQAE